MAVSYKIIYETTFVYFLSLWVFFSFFRIGTLMFSSILFVKSLVIINNHEMENKNNNTKKLRCSSTPTSVS